MSLPNKLKQTFIFAKRDLLAKISNKQYLLINLLEAPVLAFILAFIIKYKSSPDHQSYIFRFNENYPVYIMMSIIVALFMGLTVSAEEIIRDRKILKRESFLNLSWNSYLMSKIGILFLLSAIQTLLFVLVGNFILEVKAMNFTFWLVLFTTSCFANILGLNISSAFNSAVTVYILIPLLIIPQMVLSGLLFNFDKLNELVSTKGKVPVVADIMTSRWAYEAMAVEQFKQNPYQAPYFTFEQEQRICDFKASYLIDKLTEKVQYLNHHYGQVTDENSNEYNLALQLVKNELMMEIYQEGIEELNLEEHMTLQNYNPEYGTLILAYLNKMKQHYLKRYNDAVFKHESLVQYYEDGGRENYDLNEEKNKYYNESLADLVRNVNIQDRILEYDNRLLQQIDPVFVVPRHPAHLLDYRSHFFAPEKHFLNMYFNTYWFNISVIWLMCIILYFALYYEGLKRFINSFSQLNFLGKILKKK